MSLRRASRTAIATILVLSVACQQVPATETPRQSISSPSLFGMNVTFDDPDDMELLADELDAIGVEWVRLAIAAEHREGTPDFSYFDAVVDIFRSRGIEVLGLLGGAEVSCAVHTDNAWACPPDPTLEREYATYIEEVVNHFDDRIDYWESWNEPEHEEYWITGPDPSEYARVLRIQYDAIKRASPDATVLLGATGPTNLPWLARLLNELGHDQPFDAVALHPYRFLAGPHQRNFFVHADGSQTQLDLKSELLATEELFAEHYASGTFGGLDFWITEIGWGGHSKEGGERIDGFAMPSLARQARWLHQLLTLLRDDAQLHFVQAMFWWNATDITPDARIPLDHFQYYGLLRPDLSRKPAADTFSELSPN